MLHNTQAINEDPCLLNLAVCHLIELGYWTGHRLASGGDLTKVACYRTSHCSKPRDPLSPPCALGRRLEEEQAPEALLSTIWLSELSRILPELRDRYPFLPLVTGDETTARIRLFEAVTRLGQAFCERAPVVLFIDDIQWADAASLDVLHYAGRRWSESDTPLLLLLSVRSEALATTGSPSTWLTGLHHDLPVMDLTLGPLTEDETLRLLAALATGRAMAAGHLDRFADIGQWLF